ncbi:MAG: YigZ family protein [Lysobacterales bacterium]
MARHTLTGPAHYQQEIRKSRFIAKAAPVASATDAIAFIAAAAEPDARHNCFAYRIGEAYRSSDADEPAGTAGRPILAAIDGQGLDQVVVVVTRYFGGIKLGAGGLVRAYGGTAAECLRQAPRHELKTPCRLQLLLPFDCLGAAHACLLVFQAEKLDEQFDSDGVRLTVAIDSDRAEDFILQLRDHSRGRIEVA